MAHVVLQPRLWVVWICSTYLDPSLWPVTEILVCGWSMDCIVVQIHVQLWALKRPIH